MDCNSFAWFHSTQNIAIVLIEIDTLQQFTNDTKNTKIKYRFCFSNL